VTQRSAADDDLETGRDSDSVHRSCRAILTAVRPARRRATYQDIVDLPENVVGEIVDGELFASPRPTTARIEPFDATDLDLSRWWLEE
jgi:hypothetical protein